MVVFCFILINNIFFNFIIFRPTNIGPSPWIWINVSLLKLSKRCRFTEYKYDVCTWFSMIIFRVIWISFIIWKSLSYLSATTKYYAWNSLRNYIHLYWCYFWLWHQSLMGKNFAAWFELSDLEKTFKRNSEFCLWTWM